MTCLQYLTSQFKKCPLRQAYNLPYGWNWRHWRKEKAVGVVVVERGPHRTFPTCLRLLVYQAALLHTHTCTHALMRMKGIQNKNYSLILSLDLIVSCFHACFLSFNSLSYVTRFCLCLRSQCIFHLRTHSRRTIESKSFRVRERKRD
jgi:hypothetical protein